MSELVVELLLRLVKPLLAIAAAVVLFLVLVGPLGVSASVELALLCWLSAAAFVLLVQTTLF
jgi:hypothetical protein